MEIKINALKFSANESQIEFIKKKVARLERFCFDPAAVAEVTLSLLPDAKKAHIRIGDAIVDRSSASFEDAITACVTKMKEKLVREKEKAIGR